MLLPDAETVTKALIGRSEQERYRQERDAEDHGERPQNRKGNKCRVDEW
jgi:hypothetical protein